MNDDVTCSYAQEALRGSVLVEMAWSALSGGSRAGIEGKSAGSLPFDFLYEGARSALYPRSGRPLDRG
jgi:hypothetical protein